MPAWEITTISSWKNRRRNYWFWFSHRVVLCSLCVSWHFSFLMYTQTSSSIFSVSSQISHYYPKNTRNYFIFILFCRIEIDQPPRELRAGGRRETRARRIHKFEGGKKFMCCLLAEKKNFKLEFILLRNWAHIYDCRVWKRRRMCVCRLKTKKWTILEPLKFLRNLRFPFNTKITKRNRLLKY